MAVHILAHRVFAWYLYGIGCSYGVQWIGYPGSSTDFFHPSSIKPLWSLHLHWLSPQTSGFVDDEAIYEWFYNLSVFKVTHQLLWPKTPYHCQIEVSWELLVVGIKEVTLKLLLQVSYFPLHISNSFYCNDRGSRVFTHTFHPCRQSCWWGQPDPYCWRRCWLLASYHLISWMFTI